MKNLANCTPTEFVKQTYLIKKDLEKWMEHTNIKSIRAKAPDGIEQIPADVTVEEKAAIIKRNGERVKAQGMKNLSEILDKALGEYPEETIRLLALFCFVDPAHVDDHPISEYIKCVSELIQDEAVVGFFTSFYQLEQTNILNA